MKASRGEFNVTDSREGITMKTLFLKGTLFSVLLFGSLLSISCGGGGGGDSPPPASDTTAPSIPASLNATTISAGQIDLSWNASTDNVGVTGYKIYRNGTYLTTVTSNSRSDTGLARSHPIATGSRRLMRPETNQGRAARTAQRPLVHGHCNGAQRLRM